METREVEIEQNVWGFTPEGEAVILYTMRSASGAELRLTNLGAAVVSLTVPDRDGNMADVVLGYSDYASYAADKAAMGRILGRYADRIAGGTFSLHGHQYRLPRNSGRDHMNGGAPGLGERIWESRVETNRVVFSLVSPDGDQGYPGELSVEVVYDWGDDNARINAHALHAHTHETSLEITLLAHSSAATVANLANQIYFNLAGHGAGSVLEHTLQIDASRWLPTNRFQIPTGQTAPVEGTPMDFRNAKPLGRDIDLSFEPLQTAAGYDHCWVIDNYEAGKVARNAQLHDPMSGRLLTVYSSQPGLRVCTGNFLADSPAGKDSAQYKDRGGVAIVCQGFPDAPNHSDFPPQHLAPGEIYERHVIYHFGVR